MSGTDRRRISNPSFFGRAHQSASRVRLVKETRGQTRAEKKPVPAFLLAQRGFTYLGMLILVAIMGFGLAGFAELYSHAAQREKERELLFIGSQFRNAIESYYNKSPGAKVYPQKLDDLVEDKRFPMPQHHLRRVYRDPMTGKAEWGMRSVQDEPDSTSWGRQNVYDVYSLSDGTALDKTKYKDW